MLVGSKVVKPLQHKLFGGKLNNPRTVLGQKLIRVGINQLKNHIQERKKEKKEKRKKNEILAKTQTTHKNNTLVKKCLREALRMYEVVIEPIS